ncbi:MAG: hypothetical protein AB7G15_20420 [Alphaproteobacteria bacterium]
MPKVSPLLNAFNAGEWAPELEGRIDLQKYPSACRTLENFIPMPQGPLVRRPGTRFVAAVKDHARKVRLVSFKFSTAQAYILEFGHQYVRFYKDGGRIVSAKAITGAADNGSGLIRITATAHGYATGNTVTITGVGGTTEANGTWSVTVVDANRYDLQGSAFINSYTSGGTGTAIVELATPYQESELPSLRVTQSNDVLYLTHANYPVRKLSRSSHTAWTLATPELKDGPWGPENTDRSVTFGHSATTGSITLTCTNGAPFAASDVGRLFYNWNSTDPNKRGSSVITGFTSAAVVSAAVQTGGDYGYASTGASYKFAFGLYGTVNGYPRACCFFEDRLWLGGCNGAPQRVDGSVLGDYERFSPGYLPRKADGTASVTDEIVTDDMACAFQVLANDVNVIRWMMDDEKGMIVGTAGAEWTLRTSSNQAAISASNPPQARRVSSLGCADVDPVRAGRSTLFVRRDAEHLHELAYVFEDDGFRAPDLTLLASHIGRGGIRQLSFEQTPYSVVWGVRGDGQLLGLTYQREQEVVAWHRHILGGWSDAGQTAPAMVESVASIPSTDGARDETWLVVRRYIDGGSKRYLEYIAAPWIIGADQKDAYFVDCGLTYSGAPATTISGLGHLEGQSVTILADGATHPDKTVIGGQVTLDRAAGKVHFGLGYRSILQTMRLEAGAADGTAQGKTKRVHRCTFRFADTLGGRAGPNQQLLDDIPDVTYRAPSGPMGQPPVLFSGDAPFDWPGGYDSDGRITLVQSQPLPMLLLALMPQLVTQDR